MARIFLLVVFVLSIFTVCGCIHIEKEEKKVVVPRAREKVIVVPERHRH